MDNSRSSSDCTDSSSNSNCNVNNNSNNSDNESNHNKGDIDKQLDLQIKHDLAIINPSKDVNIVDQVNDCDIDQLNDSDIDQSIVDQSNDSNINVIDQSNITDISIVDSSNFINIVDQSNDSDINIVHPSNDKDIDNSPTCVCRVDMEIMMCETCGCIRCDECGEMIAMENYEEHGQTHDVNEDEEIVDVITNVYTYPETILCNADYYDGCKQINPFDNSKCSNCHRILKADNVNTEGKTLYLGQSIFFPRDDGIPEPGYISKIETGIDGNETILCRYKKTFTSSYYDLRRNIDSVFVTMDALTDSQGSRKRLSSQKFLSESSPSKKRTSTTTSSKVKPSNVKSGIKKGTKSGTMANKNIIPNKSVTSSPNSSPSKSQNVTKKQLVKRKKSDDIKEDIKDDIKDSKSKKSKVQENVIEPVGAFKLSERFDEVDIEKVIRNFDFTDRNGVDAEYHGRYLDKFLKIALMYVFYEWAVPMRRAEEEDALGENAWKPAITVVQFMEIVKYCPINVTQFVKLPMLQSLANKTSYNTAVTLGEEITNVIRSYLIERGCYDNNLINSRRPTPCLSQLHNYSVPQQLDGSYSLSIEQLTQAKLSLPLPYPYFCAIMNIVYGRPEFSFSRVALEKSSEIKGEKVVKTKGTALSTMYGGMTESFIEETLVRNFRMGKSKKFLDIGSGIGQICIQMTATTGCESTGIELEKCRYNAGCKLLAAFDDVLNIIGVEGRISSKVSFVEADFRESEDIIKKHNVIFFDNFGTWFDSEMLRIFNVFLRGTEDETQIIMINDLPQSSWLIDEKIKADKNACTWMPSEELKLFRYVKRGNVWTCNTCTMQNLYLDDNEAAVCEMCNTVKRDNRKHHMNNKSR